MGSLLQMDSIISNADVTLLIKHVVLLKGFVQKNIKLISMD